MNESVSLDVKVRDRLFKGFTFIFPTLNDLFTPKFVHKFKRFSVRYIFMCLDYPGEKTSQSEDRMN